MKEKKDVDFILLGGIVVATIWSITALYFEYTKHSYIETIWSGKEPDTGWFYVDTPVDCPPCDKEIKYEAEEKAFLPKNENDGKE